MWVAGPRFQGSAAWASKPLSAALYVSERTLSPERVIVKRGSLSTCMQGATDVVNGAHQILQLQA
jgi:hypothetical protein